MKFKRTIFLSAILLAVAALVGGYLYNSQQDKQPGKSAHELIIVENAVNLKDGSGWTHQKGKGTDSAVGTLTKSGVVVSYDYGMYGAMPVKTDEQLESKSRDSTTYQLFRSVEVNKSSLKLLAYQDNNTGQYFSGSIDSADETAIQVAKELFTQLALQ